MTDYIYSVGQKVIASEDCQDDTGIFFEDDTDIYLEGDERELKRRRMYVNHHTMCKQEVL